MSIDLRHEHGIGSRDRGPRLLPSRRAYDPIFIDRSRNALAITDKELRLIVAAAIIGLSSRWLEIG